MRKTIGYLFVLSPFIAIAVHSVIHAGWLVTLVGFAALAVICFVVLIGVLLINAE